MSRAAFVRAAMLAALFSMFAGCAAMPAVSDFERCVATVAGDSAYTPDRIRAAEWCVASTAGGAP